MTIGALGRRGWLRLGGIKQGQRLGRAANCRFADVIGLGKAGHLAGYAAQAKARISAVIGGFQPSAIKSEALAREILGVNLTIVAIFNRIMRLTPGSFGIKLTFSVQEFADIVNFGVCFR